MGYIETAAKFHDDGLVDDSDEGTFADLYDDTVDAYDVDVFNNIMELYDINNDLIIDEKDLALLNSLEGVQTGLPVGVAEALVKLPELFIDNDRLAYQTTITDNYENAADSKLWRVNEQSNWKIENGILIQVAPTGRQFLYPKGEDAVFSDVDVRTYLRFDSYQKNAGIVFRYNQTTGSYYRLSLQNNSIVIEKFQYGQKVNEWTQNLSYEIQRDQWYHIEIEAKENVMTAY